MRLILDDGGRRAAGFKGNARDCVARSVAIASGLPYAKVYEMLADGAGNERKSRGRSANNGINTNRKWFKEIMSKLGFLWTPTMGIGTGCKVHLHDGELPMGRLVVAVSRHYTAVIDGVIHDTYNPQRESSWQKYDATTGQMTNGTSRRCVYGYWKFVGAQ